MRINIKQEPSNWKRVALTTAIAGAITFAATIATAGECPADKRVADGQGQKQSTAAGEGCDRRRACDHGSREGTRGSERTIVSFAPTRHETGRDRAVA